MSDSSVSYAQKTKRNARRKALRHAVELLTNRRETAAVVPAKYVERVLDAKRRSDVAGDRWAANEVRSEDVRSWRRFRRQAVGKRKASDLTVAYLAGPEPANDLLALLHLGVRPENIWAFENEGAHFEAGLGQLRELGIRGVKLVKANIEAFLATSRRRFDIIYLDACGPLPSTTQNTVRLLVSVFRHAALAPLGVLITNFADPDTRNEEELERFAYLIAAYLYPKGCLDLKRGGATDGAAAHGFVLGADQLREAEAAGAEPDDEYGDPDWPPDRDFIEEVKARFSHYYGSFVTRHIFDIAAVIAPMISLDDPALHKQLLARNHAEATTRALRFLRMELDDDALASGAELDGEAESDSAMFSLLVTLDLCGLMHRDAAPTVSVPASCVKFLESWRRQLSGLPEAKIRAEQRIATYYAARSDPQFQSDAMRQVTGYPYGERMPFLCDVPNSELGFYTAFAQLTYPAHGNVREARRFRYRAEGRRRQMFLDVMPFDECRYVYDWLSALHLVPDNWDDLSAQLVFRFALDAIVKNGRCGGDDFLFGCHSIGIDREFPEGELGPRRNLSKARKK